VSDHTCPITTETMNTPTTPTTPDELLDYWLGNIPFKGSLVSDDGTCMCAQGQALHFLDGVSPAKLRTYGQAAADKRVAELFGISRAHAVLLRIINDQRPGAPSVVIRDPAQVLGDRAETVLQFWRHLDRMTPQQWATVRAAQAAARARAAEWDMASRAARARAAEWDMATRGAAVVAATAAAAAARAAGRAALTLMAAAAWATNEIQCAAVLRGLGRPFYFLPMFGITQPEDLLASNEVKP
jgi:hypothetical protein